ncbi:MAG: hypothetical protein JWO12_2634 [Frankiales bacterium]|nr:hypothetical protein [Frankiales bacterium]
MSTYVVLIYGNEQLWDAMTPEQEQQLAAAHEAFNAAATVLAGHELERTTSAVTLRSMNRTDGPFAETKEVLGGFYLVEADDREQVVGWAGLLYETTAGHSRVEVRPVVAR